MLNFPPAHQQIGVMNSDKQKLTMEQSETEKVQQHHQPIAPIHVDVSNFGQLLYVCRRVFVDRNNNIQKFNAHSRRNFLKLNFEINQENRYENF